MKPSHSKTMAEATRLTRSGDLAGATALIQSLLSAAPPPEPEDVTKDVVEGSFTRLADGPSVPTRQPLSETLRWIKAGGMPVSSPPLAGSEPAQDAARFTTRSYGGPQGTRE